MVEKNILFYLTTRRPNKTMRISLRFWSFILTKKSNQIGVVPCPLYVRINQTKKGCATHVPNFWEAHLKIATKFLLNFNVCLKGYWTNLHNRGRLWYIVGGRVGTVIFQNISPCNQLRCMYTIAGLGFDLSVHLVALHSLWVLGNIIGLLVGIII